MTIEQTVEIPASRRLHLDFDLPMTASVGPAKVILEFPAAGAADTKVTENIPSAKSAEDAAWEAEILRKRAEAIAADPETQAILKRAAERASDPNRPKLSDLFGSHPGIFGGIDPVAYQRNMRDEWDD
jgi:hypothetical protein